MVDNKKTIKNILIGFLLVVLLFILYVWLIAPDYDYYVGKDSVDVFGDGRFQMGIVSGRIGLDDHGCDAVRTIVYEVEKYNVIDNYIYVAGYYAAGTTDDDGVKVPSLRHLNLETCGDEWFDSQDEIPRYLILNYDTAELTTYVDWGNIPEYEQERF